MRGAPVVRAWLDGGEAVDTIGIGGGAAPAVELGVVVAALAVGLPDFHDDVIERLTVELRDAAGDLDHLFLFHARGKVVGALGELAREEWPERHLSRRDEARHGSEGTALRPRTTSWYS